MKTITLTLPDDVAAKALTLDPAVLAELIRRADSTPLPPGFDPMLLGLVDPAFYGSGKTIGDIVAPLDEKWEADQ